MKRTPLNVKLIRGRSLCNVGAAMIAGASLTSGLLMAQDTGRLEQVEKENSDLKKRLEKLENLAKKEGVLASGTESKAVSALSTINLSGFVTSSYFYDTSVPRDRVPNGYLWNQHNAFSLNKVKLTLASKPVERSGEKWDAGFRTSLIFGEDAPKVNTGGKAQGLEALREAYLEVNAPVGTGLNIKAGQLISLLNYESGDGGAVNANFSQGYQWFYTGNGPGTGVQLGYNLTDWLDAKVRVQNGLYSGPVENNDGKTVMGALGIKPDDKTWISLIGFGGDEASSFGLKGASILAGRTFLSNKLTTGLEFDYFKFDNHFGVADAELWSIGGWLGYDFTSKFGVALRAEHLSDPDGGGLKGIALGGRAGSALTSADAHGSLSSVAFTFNIKPLPNIKLQPEVRYDTTTYHGAFDGQNKRFLIGMGASYIF